MTNIAELNWTACDCTDCVAMCERRPCWPTPDEARRLIEMGYAGRLMRDYWVGESIDADDINIIGPAVEGREGRGAPFWPNGRCNLLTDDGRCELHDTGAKPIEGRLAICGDGTPDSLHETVAMMWDSQEGRSVVRLWENVMAGYATIKEVCDDH